MAFRKSMLTLRLYQLKASVLEMHSCLAIIFYLLANWQCVTTSRELVPKKSDQIQSRSEFAYGLQPIELGTEATNRFQLMEECPNGTEVDGVETYLQQNVLFRHPTMSLLKVSDVQFNFQLLDFQDPLAQALQLDPATGRLTVRGRVDRESLCSDLTARKSPVNARLNLPLDYHPEFAVPYASSTGTTCIKKLRVLSTAWFPGENQPEIHTLPIEIHIEDINDNSPEWFDIYTRPQFQTGLIEQQQQMSVIELQLPELSKDIISGQGAQPTKISLPLAHDPDDGLNGQINYRIEPVHASDRRISHADTSTRASVTSVPFVLEKQSNGMIDLVATTNLDYEKQALHQFYLIASDTGNPPRTSTALVKVHLVDVNDEAPVFERSVFYPASGAVSEKTMPGSVLLNLSATDSDASTINNRLRYSMVPNAMASKYFTVHPDGRVSLRHWLDYESMEPSNTRVHLSQNTHADNRRQFVFQVQAIDSAPQPYEKTGTAMVIVPVIDENDEAPIITVRYLGPPDQTNQGEIGAVLENSAVPTRLAYIQVRDMDFEGKDQVACHLSDSTNFSLTPISSMHPTDLGFRIETQDDAKNDFVLNLLTKTDRELTPLLFVRLKCLDQAGNANEQTMRIRVLDVNDESPKFSHPVYRFVLPENTDPGNVETEPLESNATVRSFGYRLGRVSAQDADLGNNARLFYRLEPNTLEIVPAKTFDKTSGASPDTRHGFVLRPQSDGKPKLEELFRVEPETGVVRVLKSFDAENIDLFRFAVSAIDQPANTGSVAHTGTAMIEVKITDVNDWSPVFYKMNTSGDQRNDGTDPRPDSTVEYVTNYVFRVKENRPAFWLVGRVAALDPDVSQQQQQPWSESQSTGRTLNVPQSVLALRIAQDAEPDVRKTFSLHATSGHLRTIISLDREAKAVYVFRVIASDAAKEASASRTATATVTVFVEDENDNSPVFVRPISVTQDTGQSNSLSKSSTGTSTGLNQHESVRDNDAADLKSGKSGQLDEGSHALQLSGSSTQKPGTQDTPVPIVVVHKHTWTQSLDSTGGHQLGLGRPLLQLEATDADAGENGIVTYHIGAGNRDGLFQLDNTTGTLMLSPGMRAPIEELANSGAAHQTGLSQTGASKERAHLTYLLRFEACDRGVPKRCALPIWVRMVLDMNDWPQLVGKSGTGIYPTPFDDYQTGVDSSNSGAAHPGKGMPHMDPSRDPNAVLHSAAAKAHPWTVDNADDQAGSKGGALSGRFAPGEYQPGHFGPDNFHSWVAARRNHLHGKSSQAAGQTVTPSLVVNESVIICLVLIFLVLLCAAAVLVYLVRRKVILFGAPGRNKMKGTTTHDTSDSKRLTAERYLNEPLEMAENASVYHMVQSGVTVIGDGGRRSRTSTPDPAHLAVNGERILESFPTQPLLRRNSDSRLGPMNGIPYMSSMTESIYVTNGLFRSPDQPDPVYQSLLCKDPAEMASSGTNSKPNARSMTPYCESSTRGANLQSAYIGGMLSPRGRSIAYQNSTPTYRLHSSPMFTMRSNGPMFRDMTALTSSLYASRPVKQANQSRHNSNSLYSRDTEPSKWSTNRPDEDNAHTYHELNTLQATLRRHNCAPTIKSGGRLIRPNPYTSSQPLHHFPATGLQSTLRFNDPSFGLNSQVIHETDDSSQNGTFDAKRRPTDKPSFTDRFSARGDPDASFVANLSTGNAQGRPCGGNADQPTVLLSDCEAFHQTSAETMKNSSSSLPLILDTVEEFTNTLNPGRAPALNQLSSPKSPGAGKYVYDAYREASFV